MGSLSTDLYIGSPPRLRTVEVKTEDQNTILMCNSCHEINYK